MERQVHIETTTSYPGVDFADIHRGIGDEPTLLHPTLSDLERSYTNGQAAVMLDNETPIGYVRYSPLLDESKIANLGLPEDFPEIWEIGTAFITDDPRYRGNGLYGTLRSALLETQAERMRNNKLLVLGTTKHARVLRVLPKARELGIDFYVCRHTEFGMVAPFTCVCTGSFGQGYQLTPNCPARASQEFINGVRGDINDFLGDRQRIPCTMYVSSQPLAQSIDRQLAIEFVTQDTLTSALIALGHYD